MSAAMDRDTKRVVLTGSPFTQMDEDIMGSRAMQPIGAYSAHPTAQEPR